MWYAYLWRNLSGLSTLLILDTKCIFLAAIPNSNSKGAIIKLIAIPAVVAVEKLKEFKLTINSMINKTVVSVTLSIKFLYGCNQMWVIVIITQVVCK